MPRSGTLKEMFHSDPNPYSVTELIDDSVCQRDWYARFPILLWVGTIAYVGFTVMLLQSRGSDDFTSGLLFGVNALWLLTAATYAAIKKMRASVAAGVSALVQLAIWAAMLLIPLGGQQVVNQIVGSIVAVQVGLALFYLWRETAGMSLETMSPTETAG